MKPACMTPEEYRLWALANRRLSQRAGSPCFDCPLSFAEEMRREGCCDGTPRTMRPAKSNAERLERMRVNRRTWRARNLDRAQATDRDYQRRRAARLAELTSSAVA